MQIKTLGLKMGFSYNFYRLSCEMTSFQDIRARKGDSSSISLANDLFAGRGQGSVAALPHSLANLLHLLFHLAQ